MKFDFGITRGKNINIWPILVKTKTKEIKDIQLCFTLFRSYKNYPSKLTHSHFLPIYWYNNVSANKDFRLFTTFYPTLFHYSFDNKKNIRSYQLIELAPEINFMELTKSSDGLYVKNNAFFFIWSKNDKINNKSHFIIFPVSWYYKNKEATSYTLFPLFSTGTNSELNKKYLTITPFYWHNKSTFGYKNVLFPLFWNNKKDTGIYAICSNVIFPLYWSKIERYKDNKVLFPVLWSLKSFSYKSFTLFPLISTGHSTDGLKKHISISPLFWHVKYSSGYKNVLFPVWWNKKKNQYGYFEKYNVIFPVFWSKKSDLKDNHVLFPLLWSLKNSHYHSFTILPFFSTGQSSDSLRNHVAISALYWHIKSSNGHRNILFPFWWNTKENSNGYDNRSNVIFPVYWSKKTNYTNNQVLIPLLWSFKDSYYHSFTLFPLFSTGKSTDNTRGHLSILPPLYWHYKLKTGYKNVLFPVWWNKKEKDLYAGERSSNVIFPVYWHHKDSFKNTTTILPLFWRLKYSNYKSTIFLPFFSYGHSPNGKIRHLIISPLFWNSHNAWDHKIDIIPLFSYSSDTSNITKFSLFYFLLRSHRSPERTTFNFIWPIVRYERENNYKYFRMAPIVWYKKSSGSNFFSIQPFYYYGSDSNSRSNYFLILLYSHKKYFGLKTSDNILWKLIDWEKYENNDYEFRILHLLFANMNKEGNIVKSAFPFYYYSKEKNGDKSLSIFLSFYSSFRRQIINTNEFYKEEKIFWFIRIRSNAKSLTERGINIKNTKH